jgi:hypothetical protein
VALSQELKPHWQLSQALVDGMQKNRIGRPHSARLPPHGGSEPNAWAFRRSAAMAMVGHRTEATYRRYAIADEGMLKESATKLAALHAVETVSVSKRPAPT